MVFGVDVVVVVDDHAVVHIKLVVVVVDVNSIADIEGSTGSLMDGCVDTAEFLFDRSVDDDDV